MRLTRCLLMVRKSLPKENLIKNKAALFLKKGSDWSDQASVGKNTHQKDFFSWIIELHSKMVSNRWDRSDVLTVRKTFPKANLKKGPLHKFLKGNRMVRLIQSAQLSVGKNSCQKDFLMDSWITWIKGLLIKRLKRCLFTLTKTLLKANLKKMDNCTIS
jgi:hypothetical protein